MKTYLRHKSLNVIDIKELIALEYLDFEGKYKDYVEKHDFWEICYVEKGSISLDLDGKKIELTDGEIVFISPDTTHSYYCATGNESKAFVMCFECSSQTLKSLGGMRFVTDDEHAECLRRIISEYKKTFCINEDAQMELLPNPAFGGQQAIILQLEYLLISLLRMLSSEKNPGIVFLDEDRFYEGIADVIIEFFKENLSRKLTLREICSKVNYSSSFLCKTFKEQTGETLIEYFNRLKIERACILLRETSKPIAAISRELGFSEVKYFGAIFHKIVGSSPTEYRKQNKKE